MRLILSHVPIINTKVGSGIKEGIFTAAGGGNHAFSDRLQANAEISQLLQGLFSDESKRMGYDEFVNINENVTSEMFLSLITLLQTNLPCAKNFFRYKSNYESIAGDGDETKAEGTTKRIASPRVMTKLSPVSQFVAN